MKEKKDDYKAFDAEDTLDYWKKSSENCTEMVQQHLCLFDCIGFPLL